MGDLFQTTYIAKWWASSLSIDNPHAMDRKQISAYGRILVLHPCVMANLNDCMRDCRSYGNGNLSSNSSCRDILRSIFDSTECKIDSARSQTLRKLANWLLNKQQTKNCYTNNHLLHRATLNNYYKTESKHYKQKITGPLNKDAWQAGVQTIGH